MNTLNKDPPPVAEASQTDLGAAPVAVGRLSAAFRTPAFPDLAISERKSSPATRVRRLRSRDDDISRERGKKYLSLLRRCARAPERESSGGDVSCQLIVCSHAAEIFGSAAGRIATTQSASDLPRRKVINVTFYGSRGSDV